MVNLPSDSPRSRANVTVVGLGSPHGVDQAGWLVASRIANRPEPAARVVAIAEPSLLWHHLAGCQRLILIDALAAGIDRGCVQRIVWPDARIAQSRPWSTHGLDLSSVLGLARQMGRLPSSVVLLGLEVGSDNAASVGSPDWERGLDALERRVRQEIRSPPDAS